MTKRTCNEDGCNNSLEGRHTNAKKCLEYRCVRNRRNIKKRACKRKRRERESAA